MLRCVPGRYEDMLSQPIREELYQRMCPRLFEAFSGCPVEMFIDFVHILDSSQASQQTPNNSGESYYDSVATARHRLLQWRREDSRVGSTQLNSGSLADAFRYSFLLHSFRMVERSTPAESPHIQDLVDKILNAVSEVTKGSPWVKKALWPTFMAGTEAVKPYQHDYILMRINEIKVDKGFRNLASTIILERVWKERKQAALGDSHRLWSWADLVSTASLSFVIFHDHL